MNTNRRNLLKLLPLAGLSPLFSFQNPYSAGDPECGTTADIEGPFYIPGAPFSAQLAPDGAPGTPLFITGVVYARDCETPVPGALVDVWHAGDGGTYEDDHYRGRLLTDAGGQYSFASVLPGKYLNGAQFRPRHFHYKISLEATALTTQIYFAGDTSIPGDPWASTPAAAERIIPLGEDENNNLHGVVDIYLDVDPPLIDSLAATSATAHFLGVSPNPLSGEGQVRFVLPQAAQVTIELYHLDGRKVAEANAGRLAAGRHERPFRPNGALGLRVPAGIYILRLVIDGRPSDSRRWLIQ